MNRTHTVVLTENQILAITVALRTSTVVNVSTVQDLASAIDQYRDASPWPAEELPPFELEAVDPEGALASPLSELFEDLLHIQPSEYHRDNIHGFAV